MSSLLVLLHDEPVGRLDRLEQGRLEFRYHEAWVAESRAPISLSLPP